MVGECKKAKETTRCYYLPGILCAWRGAPNGWAPSSPRPPTAWGATPCASWLAYVPNVDSSQRALEDALLEFAGSAMIISHDRWFLDRICTHILAAEGDSQWTFFDGNYQEYEADKKKRLGEEGARPHRMRFKALK